MRFGLCIHLIIKINERRSMAHERFPLFFKVRPLAALLNLQEANLREIFWVEPLNFVEANRVPF